MLLPMPFSIKMRELMVWTTDTVLPILAGEYASATADEKKLTMENCTPGEFYFILLSTRPFFKRNRYDEHAFIFTRVNIYLFIVLCSIVANDQLRGKNDRSITPPPSPPPGFLLPRWKQFLQNLLVRRNMEAEANDSMRVRPRFCRLLPLLFFLVSHCLLQSSCVCLHSCRAFTCLI